METRRVFCVFAAILFAGPIVVHAQQTRADALAAQRAEKAQHVQSYQPKGIEKVALYIQDHRIIERLTIADGWFPLIGRLTTGAGLAGGAGYRKHLFNERLFGSVVGAISTKAYKLFHANLRFPTMWDRRIELWTTFRYHDFPQEDFFGVGSGSLEANRTSYAIESNDVNVRAVVNAPHWLQFGGEVGRFSPTVGHGTDSRFPSTEELFTDAQAPGLAEQPPFLYKNLFVEFDTRDQPGNARSGTFARGLYGFWDDRTFHAYSFHRFDGTFEQFIPIFDKKRVFAFHFGVTYTDNEHGSRTPFYLLPYIGGANTLRGFRDFRFADQNALVMNAEYRWEAFAGLDMALFFDAGEVRADWEDIGVSDLKTSYGLGFRFNTYKNVFLRFDIGTGGHEGTRLFLKFGPIF
jgi:Omp85 superfamily domain